MIRVIIIFYVFILTGVAQLSAQSPKDLAKKVQDAYEGVERLHTVISVHYFNNASEEEAYRVDRSEIWKKDDWFRMKSTEIETLLNDKFYLTVNHTFKQISYQSIEKGQLEKLNQQNTLLAVDSLLSAHLVNSSLQETRSLWRLHIKDSGMYSDVELMIDKDTYFISQINLTYKKEFLGMDMFITIKYEGFEANGSIDDQVFSEDQFLELATGKLVGAKKYKTYEVQEVEQFLMN